MSIRLGNIVLGEWTMSTSTTTWFRKDDEQTTYVGFYKASNSDRGTWFMFFNGSSVHHLEEMYYATHDEHFAGTAEQAKTHMDHFLLRMSRLVAFV